VYKNIFAHDEMKRAEHMAVRESVGWYYFTHQLIEVTGADATAFLDYIYPNRIDNLAVGRDRYTVMLNDEARSSTTWSSCAWTRTGTGSRRSTA